MEVLIYRVADSSGRVYIGQTRRYRGTEKITTAWAVANRWKEHVRSSKKPGINQFHRAIQERGSSNFRVKIIDGCPLSMANNLESSYIHRFNSCVRGYNGNRGCGKPNVQLPYAQGAMRDLIKTYNAELDRMLNQTHDSFLQKTWKGLWRKVWSWVLG